MHIPNSARVFEFACVFLAFSRRCERSGKGPLLWTARPGRGRWHDTAGRPIIECTTRPRRWFDALAPSAAEGSGVDCVRLAAAARGPIGHAASGLDRGGVGVRAGGGGGGQAAHALGCDVRQCAVQLSADTAGRDRADDRGAPARAGLSRDRRQSDGDRALAGDVRARAGGGGHQRRARRYVAAACEGPSPMR